MKKKVDKEQIERISQMEEILDNATLVIDNLNEAIERYLQVVPDIEGLVEYSQSDLFMRDYEADEMGLLPDDLKRGVLSEDGISGIVEKRVELIVKLKGLLGA